MSQASRTLLGSDPNKKTFIFAETIQGKKRCVKEQIFSDFLLANGAIKEALLQSRVKHANVCTVYDMGLHKGKGEEVISRIVMELMHEDVGKAIQRRARTSEYWSEQQMLLIAKQLIDALAHAQLENVSHRDVKLQNILIDESGQTVKLSDFGNAKWISDMTLYHTLSGTPLTFSPQMAEAFGNYLMTGNDQSPYNPYKSDVYSLAVCLTMMAALKTKINSRERNWNDTIKAEIADLRCSPEFRQLLMTMVAYREEDRPDFIEMENEMHELLQYPLPIPPLPASPEPQYSITRSVVSIFDSADGSIPNVQSIPWEEWDRVEVSELDPEPTTTTMNISERPQDPLSEASIQASADGSIPGLESIPWGDRVNHAHYDDTFDRADSDAGSFHRSQLQFRDSTLLPAMCVVCKEHRAGFIPSEETKDEHAQAKAVDVCSQQCLDALLNTPKCLECKRVCSADSMLSTMPCSPNHCFCQKSCFLTFVAKRTNYFTSEVAIHCPLDGFEVPQEEVQKALASSLPSLPPRDSFRSLSRSLRPCSECSAFQSMYLLPCDKHWACVDCIGHSKAQNFRCKSCR